MPLEKNTYVLPICAHLKTGRGGVWHVPQYILLLSAEPLAPCMSPHTTLLTLLEEKQVLLYSTAEMQVFASKTNHTIWLHWFFNMADIVLGTVQQTRSFE